MPIARPQNVQGVTGHQLCRGSAPVFVTTKLTDIDWLGKMSEADPRTGLPWDSDAPMLRRRMKVFRFQRRMPPAGAQFVHCPTCFAQLLLAQGRPRARAAAVAAAAGA